MLEHVEANRTRHLIERGVPLEEIEGDFNVAVSARSQTGHNSGDESHGVDPCTGYVDDNGYVIDASDVAKILAAQQSTNDEATTPLTVGSTLFVDLPGHDISGDFTVTAIRPCPTPNPGDGCLVTTKFIHENAEILDLRIEGSVDPIGTTASHPFWSEDRQQFVPAGELRIGENLQLADDTSRRVESLTRRETRETVYNIEVDGEHVFYVGEDGVLVHNSCGSHVYVIRNAANEVVYVGTGTAGRVRSATARIANALFGGNKDKAKNLFKVTSKKFKNEFQARAMEQRLLDHYRAKGRGFLERGKKWSKDHDGLWNKQNGYNRDRSTGIDRRDAFNSWYDDDDLFQIALGI